MSKELEQARELVRMLEEKEKSERVKLSSLKLGETFMIGEHEFIVLEQIGLFGATKVLSKNFMAENIEFGNGRNYKDSNLERVIKNEIQPIIENEVGANNIVESEVSIMSLDGQNEFGTYTGKVRPMSFDEVRKYSDLIPNEDLDDWWWTLTPWSTEKRGHKYSMSVVSPRGGVYNYGCDDYSGVRPFCILKSNILVSRGKEN